MIQRSDLSSTVFNWKDKKILMVEDDYAIYLYFQEMLCSSQACLIRAVSLQEAFDILTANSRYDLLIINTNIPGNENCRSIRRIKSLWPDLQIIAVAGCDCKGRNKQCYPLGCDTMVSYNTDGADMRSTVNEMFYPVN